MEKIDTDKINRLLHFSNSEIKKEKVEIEYAIYDTNVKHDNVWLKEEEYECVQ